MTRQFAAGVGRRLIRNERGVALPVVMFVGAALLLITTVITMRSISRIDATGLDADWETALHVADTGLNEGLASKHITISFDTGETLPVFTSADEERDWALSAAQSASVTEAGVGEYALVVPVGAGVMYSVGYVPSRGAPGVRTRVVRAEYVSDFYQAKGALTSGGNVDFLGNGSLLDPSGGQQASLHANGTVETSSNSTIEGCITSGVSTIAATGDCEESPLFPLWQMPLVDPMVYYSYAEIVLCPDGVARAGPSHSLVGDSTPETPCDTLDPIVDRQGWSSKVTGGVRTWDPKNVDPGGVVYVYQGSVDGKLGKPGTPVTMTLLVEGLSGWETCTPLTSGSVSLSAGSFMVASLDPGSSPIGVIATGDVYYRGGATVQGAIFANEQVNYGGGPESYGPVLAASACDSYHSPVTGDTSLGGGSVINFGGNFETLFEVGIIPTSWNEL